MKLNILRDFDFAVLRPPIVPSEDVPHGVPGAVFLRGQCYLVHAITDTAFNVVAVRFDGLSLSKAKDWIAKNYTVKADGQCDCPDAIFRNNRHCKHSAAAGLLGLIEEPPPRHTEARVPSQYASLPF
jgi:hypothetical protein